MTVFETIMNDGWMKRRKWFELGTRVRMEKRFKDIGVMNCLVTRLFSCVIRLMLSDYSQICFSPGKLDWKTGRFSRARVREDRRGVLDKICTRKNRI